MKNVRSLSLATLVATTLVCSNVAQAAATDKPSASNGCASSPAAKENEDIALACKIAELDNGRFHTTNNGKKLESDFTDQELKQKYGFSASQVASFREIIDGTYTPTTVITEPQSLPFQTAANAGPRYYISNEALTTGAFVAVATAAEAGPYALAAAFTAVSGMMGDR